MERNILLTLAGIAMGISIAILWYPVPRPAKTENVVEAWSPPYDPVPPGHRGIVIDMNGEPAGFVDVFMTELDGWHRLWNATRTNREGHFPIRVPPGRYRVQGRFIDHEVTIPDATQHPDIEVRIVPQPLLRFLSTVR